MDNVEKVKESIRKDKRLSAELRKFYDDHKQALMNLKISEQEFNEAIETYSFRLAGLALDNDTKRANLKKLGLDNIRMDFENRKLEVDVQPHTDILNMEPGLQRNIMNAVFWFLDTASGILK